MELFSLLTSLYVPICTALQWLITLQLAILLASSQKLGSGLLVTPKQISLDILKPLAASCGSL